MAKMPTFFRRCLTVLISLVLFAPVLPARAENAPPTTRPFPLIDTAAVPGGAFVLHLPGIGGYLRVDQRFMSGLKQGGLDAQIRVYDWTEHDPGLHALHAFERNKKEAKRIADMIDSRIISHPTDRICITGHSGGCAMTIWALEDLPKDMQVDDVVLLAPAISPTYDLTAALKHVRGHLYSFTSTGDILILSTGTKLFGTMDGVTTDAAGFGGFQMPKTADAEQYKKLIAKPYDPEWVKYGNAGDHIGPMAKAFSAAIVAPLLEPQTDATTQPGQ